MTDTLLSGALRALLDTYVKKCEACARAEGWVGPWSLQDGDLDWLVARMRRRLTPAVGEYLQLPRWAGTHVDWNGDDEGDLHTDWDGND